MKKLLDKLAQNWRNNKFWIIATTFAMCAGYCYPNPEAKGFCIGYAFISGVSLGLSLCKE